MLNQSLQVRLGQQLKMTAQLQHAIRLLQLSSQELQQEIQEVLLNNPMLEVDEEEINTADTPLEQQRLESEIDRSMENQETLPDELPVDSHWEDTYDMPVSSTAAPDDQTEFQETNTAELSLRDHLLEQLNLAPVSERDFSITLALIDAIDPKGYLESSLETVQQALELEPPVELDELTTQLHLLQRFDPTGVGARDLQECLLLQLQQLDPNKKEEPTYTLAQQVLEDHFDLLSAKQQTKLCKKLKTTPEKLEATMELIRTFNPHPGEEIQSIQTEYITPDLIIHRGEKGWIVELAPETRTKLRVSPYYQSLKQQQKTGEDAQYIRKNVQDARWFLKSLSNRNETLLKVTTHIFQVQSAFLDGGASKMKALTLKAIAGAVEMHESTISRVTTNKYVQTPQGLFELKYFFSSQLGTADGDGTSSVAVRSLIQKIVDDEDQKKPVSDQKISQLLAEEGIKIARRTVAKYRDILAIPPSNERKQPK